MDGAESLLDRRLFSGAQFLNLVFFAIIFFLLYFYANFQVVIQPLVACYYSWNGMLICILWQDGADW